MPLRWLYALDMLKLSRAKTLGPLKLNEYEYRRVVFSEPDHGRARRSKCYAIGRQLRLLLLATSGPIADVSTLGLRKGKDRKGCGITETHCSIP